MVDETNSQIKDSERLTLLLSCNSVGDKLPSCFIGKSKKPRCFKDFDFSKLKILYCSNKSAWMTRIIFEEWLIMINEIMKINERKILLILDNATSHDVADLSNVKLLYLPPKTSALIQPLDMGVIKAVKDKYREMLSLFILSRLDKKDKLEMKQIKVIHAILWAEEAWENVTTETINNCWKKSGLLKNSCDELVFSEKEENVKMFEDDNEKENKRDKIVKEACLNLKFDYDLNYSGIFDDQDLIGLKTSLKSISDILLKYDQIFYKEYFQIEKKLLKKIIKNSKMNDIRFFMNK